MVSEEWCWLVVEFSSVTWYDGMGAYFKSSWMWPKLILLNWFEFWIFELWKSDFELFYYIYSFIKVTGSAGLYLPWSIVILFIWFISIYEHSNLFTRGLLSGMPNWGFQIVARLRSNYHFVHYHHCFHHSTFLILHLPFTFIVINRWL